MEGMAMEPSLHFFNRFFFLVVIHLPYNMLLDLISTYFTLKFPFISDFDQMFLFFLFLFLLSNLLAYLLAFFLSSYLIFKGFQTVPDQSEFNSIHSASLPFCLSFYLRLDFETMIISLSPLGNLSFFSTF